MRRYRSLPAPLAALALLSVGLAWFLAEEDREAASGEPAWAPGPVEADLEPAPAGEGERARSAAPEPAPARLAPPSFPARGLVLDLDGAPVANLPLHVADDAPDDPPRAVTGADGRFELLAPRAATRIAVAAPGWSVVSGDVYRRGEAPMRLLVARSSDCIGRVLDATSGAPVHGASVSALPAPIDWSRLPAAGDATDEETRDGLARRIDPRGQTDPDGRFHLRGVLRDAGTRVQVEARGFEPAVIELGSGTTDLGTITLVPGHPSTVSGRVLLATGEPAAGAEVALGGSRTVADLEGTFRLSLALPEPGAPLVARLAPHPPSIVPGIGDRLQEEDVDELTLRLGDRGFAITGVVVDAEGAPLRRWYIEARDAEGKNLVAQSPRTRKDGRFAIEGLPPGEYTVVGHRREDERFVTALTVPAPTGDLRLRLTEDTRSLAGVAQDPAGRPAAGLTVRLATPGSRRSAPTVVTDAAGRFVFEGAPAHAAWLETIAEGRSDLPARLAVGSGDEAGLVLRLGAAARVRFESAGTTGAPDALFAVDAAGRPRPIWFEGARATRVALRAGRGGPFLIEEGSTHLVLTRLGRRIGSVPVEPSRDGAETLVRW